MSKLVYTDRAGNKLYKKYVKSRKTWQFYGKNRQGKLVNERGVTTLMKRSGMQPRKSRARTRPRSRKHRYSIYRV